MDFSKRLGPDIHTAAWRKCGVSGASKAISHYSVSNSRLSQKLVLLFYFISRCRILLIRTLNRAILVSTEIPWSLEYAHANEGAMEGHHVDKKIACLL